MIKFKKIKELLKKNCRFFKVLKEDKRVPFISKILLWMALAYFLMPFDLIPDFIPVFGQLDDLVIIPSLIFLALMFIPKEVYKEHYDRIFNK